MPRLKSWSKEQAKQIANINKAIAEKVGVALSKTMQGDSDIIILGLLVV